MTTINDHLQAAEGSGVRATLADIYRPETLDHVVGQQATVETLRRLIESDSLPPVLLFEGGPGLGKTSLARIVARSLNCTQSDKPTTTPCGECAGCQMIELSDGHPDCIELNCGSHSGVEEIRELVAASRVRAMDARVKINILDEFQLLSTAARVALTKPLELPPPGVLWILTTTDIKAVPKAILSRSLHFKVLPINQAEVVERLRWVAEDMGLAVAPAALEEIGAASAGSMRNALIFLGQFAGVEDEVTVDLVRRCLPALSETDLLAMIKALVENNPLGLLKALNAVPSERRSPEDVLPALGQMLADFFLVELLEPADAGEQVRCSQAALAELQALKGSKPASTIHRWAELLLAEEAMGSGILRRDIALQMTLLGLIYKGHGGAQTSPAEAAPAEPLVIKQEAREIKRVQSQDPEVSKRISEQVGLAKQLDWDAVIEALATTTAKTAARSTKVLGVDDGVVTLKLSRSSLARYKPEIATAVQLINGDVKSIVWEG